MNEFLAKLKEKYSINDILKYLDDIKNLSILAVGDTIIDAYQYGETLGKSGKAPIVAFQENNKELYDGGVLAIYNHLKGFAKVDYFTGKKKVIKKRFIDNNQKIFETYKYEENERYLPLNKKISDYDLILIADFGHGFIDKRLQETLESESKYIALNTQLNAGNMGLNTINKYTHRNYISIDTMELRLAASNQFDTIEDIIRKRFNHETVSITDRNKGSILYRNNELLYVPAFAKNIIDTTGAGDAYLSITSPLAYIQSPLDIIGFLGNVAGAIACTYQGNKESVTKEKLIKFIEELLNE